MCKNKLLQRIAIYLIPVILLSYLIINDMVVKVKQELEEENQRHLLIAVHYVDAILENYLAVLNREIEIINNFDNDPASLAKFLRYLPAQNPGIRCINLVDRQGRVIASSEEQAKQLNLAERAYFQQVLLTGKPYVSDLFINKLDGKNSFSLAVPVIQEGQLIGVLSSVVTLDFLQSKMHGTLVNKEKGMLLTIVDGAGTIICSSDPRHTLAKVSTFPVVQQVLAGKEGVREEFAPIRQEWRVFNYAPLQKAHWGMMISQPSSRAYHLAGYITSQAILVIILLLIPLIALISNLFKIEKLRYLELTELQQEKARTINELAASVAHEIRNPLTSIRGFMQLLARNNLSKKAGGYVRVVIEEVDRLEGIVGGFLNFTKSDEEGLGICDLKEVLKVIHALAESRGHYNKVKVNLDAPKSIFIKGNQSQLKQAFINFSINALDAMPEGGTLKISLFEEREKGVVIFEDTGCGMPPEILRRLGDHYFTTKENGTGLGIAVSYRILSKHQAKVQVSSESGQGTIFKIVFPLEKALFRTGKTCD